MDVNAEDVIADLLDEIRAAKRDKAYQAAAVVRLQRELNTAVAERDDLARRLDSVTSDCGPNPDVLSLNDIIAQRDAERRSVIRLEKELTRAQCRIVRLERKLENNGINLE